MALEPDNLIGCVARASSESFGLSLGRGRRHLAFPVIRHEAGESGVE